MDYMQKEAIRQIATQLPKQDSYEIMSVLVPLEKELGITVSNNRLTLKRSGQPSGSIPLNKIHAATVTSTHVLILCRNKMIFSFDRRIGKYEAIMPENDEPGFWEMFRMMCRSYLERWKNRKK